PARPRRGRGSASPQLLPGYGDAGRGAVLHQTDHVGEARGVGGGAQHDRDQVTTAGADPGRHAVAGLQDEAGLAAADLAVAAPEQASGVDDLVRAPARAEQVEVGGGDVADQRVVGGDAKQFRDIGGRGDVAFVEARPLDEVGVLETEVLR